MRRWTGKILTAVPCVSMKPDRVTEVPDPVVGAVDAVGAAVVMAAIEVAVGVTVGAAAAITTMMLIARVAVVGR